MNYLTSHIRQLASLDASPDTDPILEALEDARNRRDQADYDIRVLLAFARELTRPRPYRLTDLATAAGMSISGVRIAYARQHVEDAQRLLHAADHQTTH
jgi:hypothetical protein